MFSVVFFTLQFVNGTLFAGRNLALFPEASVSEQASRTIVASSKKINVATVGGKEFSLSFRESPTVRDVKQQVAEQLDVFVPWWTVQLFSIGGGSNLLMNDSEVVDAEFLQIVLPGEYYVIPEGLETAELLDVLVRAPPHFKFKFEDDFLFEDGTPKYFFRKHPTAKGFSATFVFELGPLGGYEAVYELVDRAPLDGRGGEKVIWQFAIGRHKFPMLGRRGAGPKNKLFAIVHHNQTEWRNISLNRDHEMWKQIIDTQLYRYASWEDRVYGAATMSHGAPTIGTFFWLFGAIVLLHTGLAHAFVLGW